MTENATTAGTEFPVEPDFSRPNSYAIYVLLARAGAEGMQAGELACRFAGPPPDLTRRKTDSPRNRLVNTILNQRLEAGLVRRSRRKEPSTVYHNVPTWRWFITAAGLYLSSQGPAWYRAEQEKAKRDRFRQDLEDRFRLRQQAAEQAIADGYGPHTPRCQRQPKIVELREQHLTLDEIGLIFGVTREYVRLIVLGRDSPCRCPLHPPRQGRTSRQGRTWRRTGPQNWPRKQGVRLPKPGSLGALMADWADVDVTAGRIGGRG